MAEKIELSAVEIQELLDNATPNSAKRATQFGMTIFNGKYLWNVLRNFEDKEWSSEVDNKLISAQCYNYIFIYLVAASFQNQLKKCQKKS